MAWAGSVKLPALLISRLWFNSRMSSCQVDGLGAIPGSRTNSSQAARQHAAESPKLTLLRAARRQPAILIWGRGRQAMHLPCKQAYVGALPTDSTSLRPLRCGGRRLPRRSSESGGGHYVPQSSGLRLGGPISTAGNSTNAQREAS